MYHVHVMSALGGGVEGVGKNLTKGREVVMIWYGGSLPGIRVTHKHSTQEEQPALTHCVLEALVGFQRIWDGV